ncbi:hypothetical protein VP1G_10845 [Cytospora mali]|uniref:Uncharacterized protein n=1 Tax=Cytospora mali TaxID=578113 RepID=A0A194UX75_CYTMA|nr:hypothetical protein VP1G_10845 [Valsa mali var. pyri (nom. inval.)]
MEKTRTFRSNFDTIQAYQDTSPGSVAWKLRLLELVAIACHNIAGHLYQMDDGVHKHAEWDAWCAKKRARLTESSSMRDRRECYRPTLFYIDAYMNAERFPNGLADVVGYWAELRIFGGVVLFDRGESEEECNGIYIHRPGNSIAPPTERQFNDLVNYLLSPNVPAMSSRCPLPIKISMENKWRWHPYTGMADYHIFKYRHEIPQIRPRDHCVITPDFWPQAGLDQILDEEFYKTLNGEPSDEALVAAKKEQLRSTITPTSFFWPEHEKEVAKMQPDKKKQGRPPYFFDP